MNIPITLIFDLDGTLVESAPDLCGAMNAVLKSEGREEVSLDDVRLMVGQGARALIEKGMKQTGAPATKEDVERLFPVFMDYYTDHIADYSTPFPHLLEALEELKTKGYIFAICTNKPEAASHLLVDSLDMGHWFASLIGADSLPTKKPDPEPLIAAAERAGGDISKAIMIGDSITDVSAARNAGIPVIGVSFGYTQTPMAELNPDEMIDGFPELVGVVQKISEQF